MFALYPGTGREGRLPAPGPPEDGKGPEVPPEGEGQRKWPGPVGDLDFGPTEVVSYDLNPKTVVEFLLQEGLNCELIWPLLDITKTSLERG